MLSCPITCILFLSFPLGFSRYQFRKIGNYWYTLSAPAQVGVIIFRLFAHTIFFLLSDSFFFIDNVFPSCQSSRICHLDAEEQKLGFTVPVASRTPQAVMQFLVSETALHYSRTKIVKYATYHGLRHLLWVWNLCGQKLVAIPFLVQ